MIKDFWTEEELDDIYLNEQDGRDKIILFNKAAYEEFKNGIIKEKIK